MNEEINTFKKESNFFSIRFDKQKIILLIIFLILTALLICLPFFSSIENYYSFNLYGILKSLVFFVWLLYSSFLLDFYCIFKYTKAIVFFVMAVILTSLFFIMFQINLLFLPIALHTFLIITIISFTKLVGKKSFKTYKENLNKNKLTFLTFFGFTAFTILLQIIWFFKSPDSLSIFLSARTIVESNSVEIYEPLIEISPGFIRKLFFKTSEITMRSQYPIGAIYLIAVMMKYAVYWRIIFIVTSIIFAQEVYDFYKNIKNESPSPIAFFLIIFLSQVLIELTTGIGIDLIATTICLIGVTSFLNYTTQRRIRDLAIFIIISIIVSLLKVSVFVFYLFLIFIIFIHTLKTNEQFRITIKDLLQKYKIMFIIFFVIIFSALVAIFILSLQGYLQQFSIIYKLTLVFYAPRIVFYNFTINLIQILLIYAPIFIEFIIPKKWRNSNEFVVKKDAKRIIALPLVIFSFIFIFFWNSSNIYPFDIGCRYFLLAGVVIALLSNIKEYKKKLKVILIIYIVITNSAFLLHAGCLDYANRKFADDVINIVDDKAIIVTNYYSKLFPDRIVYLTGVRYAGNETSVVNDIRTLLESNYTIYFIPEGDMIYDQALYQNFTLTLIYEYIPKGIFRIFPKFGNYDLINPAPRKLFEVAAL